MGPPTTSEPAPSPPPSKSGAERNAFLNRAPAFILKRISLCILAKSAMNSSVSFHVRYAMFKSNATAA